MVQGMVIRSEYLAVLDTLRGIQAKYKQKYCFPSQNTIIELLEEYHGIKICRRTLNYWLERLEDGGFLFRIRRHTRKNGELILRTTAYYIADRGQAAMKKLRKISAYMGRLAKVCPFAVQKVAHNTFSNKTRYKARDERSGLDTDLKVMMDRIAAKFSKH